MTRNLSFVVLILVSALASASAVRISEEELVTVTDRSFAVSWVTNSATASTISYGQCSNVTKEEPSLWTGVKTLVIRNEPTKFHYAEVDGLQSGVEYCYQILADGNVGENTRWSPGYLQAAVPPPGQYLFRFATINDMHVGEKVAGLIVIDGVVLTPGFEWPDEENPYWKFTNEAAVKEINERNVDFTIVKGDISSGYKESEFEAAKEILDRLENPYHVLRGNHDRVQDSIADYYRLVFDLNQTYFSFDYAGFHFTCLDSVNLTDGLPMIDETQFDWLEQDFAANGGSRTFLFLHHAATAQANVWSIPEHDRERLYSILSRNPQVVGVFSGHSHRVKRTRAPALPNLPFVETTSSKEYPMGYTIYDVYEGGYLQYTYRTTCDWCLEWNSMTRQEFFRTAPLFMFGPHDSRHLLHVFP